MYTATTWIGGICVFFKTNATNGLNWCQGSSRLALWKYTAPPTQYNPPIINISII